MNQEDVRCSASVQGAIPRENVKIQEKQHLNMIQFILINPNISKMERLLYI